MNTNSDFTGITELAFGGIIFGSHELNELPPIKLVAISEISGKKRVLGFRSIAEQGVLKWNGISVLFVSIIEKHMGIKETPFVSSFNDDLIASAVKCKIVKNREHVNIANMPAALRMPVFTMFTA